MQIAPDIRLHQIQNIHMHTSLRRLDMDHGKERDACRSFHPQCDLAISRNEATRVHLNNLAAEKVFEINPTIRVEYTFLV
jgi:hypothetical protein